MDDLYAFEHLSLLGTLKLFLKWGKQLTWGPSTPSLPLGPSGPRSPWTLKVCDDSNWLCDQ